MQLALYRAERPEIFDDVIGQKQIIKILRNQIRSGTVSQAYLFAGTHGTGKTTTARILAKAVNCIGPDALEGKMDGRIPCGECEHCKAIREGRFMDVVELDAASNNGVDDLRAIIDLVKYPPSIGKYKVYIIDEVHMLTPAAENAFLKTLEEPPEYAIFILATTDPQKVRATIRSRCMQLNFKRVSEDELINGMSRICQRRGIEVTSDALATVAAKADGSVRDSLSILEQCMAAGDAFIDKDLVLEYTGSAGENFFFALTEAVTTGNLSDAIYAIDEAMRAGKDAKQILKDWLEHYRNLMIAQFVDRTANVISSSEENVERLRNQANGIATKDIERAIRLISEYINLGRYSDRPRILLETLAVRLAGSEADWAIAKERPSKAKALKQAPQRVELETPAATPVEVVAKPTPAPDNADANIDAGAEQSSQLVDAIDGQYMPSESEDASIEAQAASTASIEYDEHGSADQPDESLEEATYADDLSPAQIWQIICNVMNKKKGYFASIVETNSAATSYDRGELVVYIKEKKLKTITEEDKREIQKIAKEQFGEATYVTLVAGDPSAVPKQEIRTTVTHATPIAASSAPTNAPTASTEPQLSAEEIARNVNGAFDIKVSLT